jgi:hypothetical protein
MKHNLENPWKNIPSSSKNKCEIGIPIYWYANENSDYVLRIENINSDEAIFSDIILEGIDVKLIKYETNTCLNLILLKKENWEIFYYFCSDIINLYRENSNISANKIRLRLLKWVEMLKKKQNRELSLITQMGLFSELYFLFEILNKRFGLEKALRGWYGPEFDKQDFDLGDFLVEVKSYRNSDKYAVQINSADQLDARDRQLFLAAIGLVIDTKGLSISEFIANYSSKIEKTSTELQVLFYSKLFQVGYDLNNPESANYKFKVTEFSLFKVNEGFPCFTSSDLVKKPGIDSIQYVLRLTDLERFRVELNSLDLYVEY